MILIETKFRRWLFMRQNFGYLENLYQRNCYDSLFFIEGRKIDFSGGLFRTKALSSILPIV